MENCRSVPVAFHVNSDPSWSEIPRDGKRASCARSRVIPGNRSPRTPKGRGEACWATPSRREALPFGGVKPDAMIEHRFHHQLETSCTLSEGKNKSEAPKIFVVAAQGDRGRKREGVRARTSACGA